MFEADKLPDGVMLPCVVICPFLFKVATGDSDSPMLSPSTTYAGTTNLTAVDVAYNHIVWSQNTPDQL